ncbi:MAG: hypothetical protein RLZZ176_78 [Cyanobacteriota bacterium]|jgi:hypothetical protein
MKKTEVINAEHLEIIDVPIDKIIPYHNNPKLHPQKGIDKLVASMTAVKGKIIFHQPITLDNDNVIIGGHGRRLAAKQLGLKTIPCSYLSVSKEEAMALRIADNDAFGLEYDLKKLEQEIEKLNAEQKIHLGYDAFDVDKMLEECNAEIEKEKKRNSTATQKKSNIFKETEDEWEEIDVDDETEYHPKEKRLETVLCEGLSLELHGETEVKTPIGYIDIMTDSQIIEVKRVRKWKWALGQILVYGLYYPDHKKRIHLFGRCKESKLQTIKDHCGKFDVVVTWQYEEFRP